VTAARLKSTHLQRGARPTKTAPLHIFSQDIQRVVFRLAYSSDEHFCGALDTAAQ